MTPEALILFSILKSYGAHPRLRLWRANTGAAMVHGRLVRFGVPGQGDISGLISPSGRRLEIEVKAARGRQSDDQKRWERVITSMGGLYVLARDVETVDRALAAEGITR